MLDIDFLPARYREQSSHRKARLMRIAVVLLFTCGLGAAAVGQLVQKRALASELVAVRQQFDSAQQSAEHLASLHTSLADLRAHAELHTYLRHPWPRTRILTAIVQALPESIALRQLQVTRELDEAAAQSAARRDNPEAAEAAAVQPSAAVRDLEQLRAETDSARVVVVLQGVAREHTELHDYLATLNASELFDAVQLESIESHAGEAVDDAVFRARLVVRPGIGQPGGPLRAEASGELEQQAPAGDTFAVKGNSNG